MCVCVGELYADCALTLLVKEGLCVLAELQETKSTPSERLVFDGHASVQALFIRLISLLISNRIKEIFRGQSATCLSFSVSLGPHNELENLTPRITTLISSSQVSGGP